MSPCIHCNITSAAHVCMCRGRVSLLLTRLTPWRESKRACMYCNATSEHPTPEKAMLMDKLRAQSVR
eukprot:5380653-Pyramimonas_sp.AAC.1